VTRRREWLRLAFVMTSTPTVVALAAWSTGLVTW